jgi:hypothetical protein
MNESPNAMRKSLVERNVAEYLGWELPNFHYYRT